MSEMQVLPLEPAALKPGAALRILPAGTFQSKDGRPASMTNGRIGQWRLDAVAAAAVIAAPRNGTDGYVIDFEHQTLNKEKNGNPAPAAGWFKGLEWREGQGLFMVQIEWTERARTMIASREYRYLSPVFGFDAQTGTVTYIHSVALTNDPALVGLSDLAAATAASPQATVSGSSISEEDRAKLVHVFGNVPGFSIGEAIASAGAQAAATAASAPDAHTMNEQELANFKHVFGWAPA